MDVLAPALALALGFVLGLGVGAARAFRLAAQRRRIQGLNARMAHLWPESLPTRSATDIMAGRVRVYLGGAVYDLPVLPRRASREWLEGLDERFHALGAALDAAGDDTPRILSMLAAHTESLVEMLRSYDTSGVLPDPDIIDTHATDAEILRALIEVWRAAHPLAATLAGTAETRTSGTSSESPTSSPSNTAGTPPSLSIV